MRTQACGIVAVIALLSAVIGRNSARAEWTNITHDVGGEKWGYAGVCLLTAVPGSAALIAGVSEAGLWRTDNLGASWYQLAPNDSESIRHRPHQIVFDPAEPKHFWVSGCYGASPRLIPESRMRQYKQPARSIPRVPGGLDGHEKDWIRACKGGAPACSEFQIAAPYTEWLVLGSAAVRVEGKLIYDAKTGLFTNSPEANRHLQLGYRKGWEVAGDVILLLALVAVATRRAENDATLRTLDEEARARHASGAAAELVRRIRSFFDLA